MENLDNYPANASPQSDRVQKSETPPVFSVIVLGSVFVFGPRGFRGPVLVTEQGQLLGYRILPVSLCGRNWKRAGRKGTVAFRAKCSEKNRYFLLGIRCINFMCLMWVFVWILQIFLVYNFCVKLEVFHTYVCCLVRKLIGGFRISN